jgi:hypothetical protein
MKLGGDGTAFPEALGRTGRGEFSLDNDGVVYLRGKPLPYGGYQMAAEAA